MPSLTVFDMLLSQVTFYYSLVNKPWLFKTHLQVIKIRFTYLIKPESK